VDKELKKRIIDKLLCCYYKMRKIAGTTKERILTYDMKLEGE
jgi:hypothetical protein